MSIVFEKNFKPQRFYKQKRLTINEKSFLWVLKNPFYCGFIVSRHIPGEIIIGKQPAIIVVEIFLRANEIHLENLRSGVAKAHKQDQLPLKVFAKDEKSNIPFTGYLNRKKNIYYYKTRGTGAAVNVSAARLNSRFGQLLENFEFKKDQFPVLKSLI